MTSRGRAYGTHAYATRTLANLVDNKPAAYKKQRKISQEFEQRTAAQKRRPSEEEYYDLEEYERPNKVQATNGPYEHISFISQRRRVRDEPELKVNDSAYFVQRMDTSGNGLLCNGLFRGNDYNQRAGRVITITRLQLEASIIPNSNTDNSVASQNRLICIWDKQSNGVSPSLAELFSDPSKPGTSFPNLDNRDRFVWIWDKRVTLGNRVRYDNNIKTYKGLMWESGEEAPGSGIIKTLGLPGPGVQTGTPEYLLNNITFLPGTAAIPTATPWTINYVGSTTIDFESNAFPWKKADDTEVDNTVTTWAIDGKVTKTIHFDTDIYLQSVYNADNNGTISDIVEGALYLLWFSNTPSVMVGPDLEPAYYIQGHMRMRFTDN